MLRECGTIANPALDLFEIDLTFCHGPPLIPTFDSFCHDADLPVPECAIVVEIMHLESGLSGVALEDLRSTGESSTPGRRFVHPDARRGIARFVPTVHE
jgi:hypothetical protein